MKNYFLVLCLLPLFLLSSCKDSSLSDLAKDNQWNQVAIEAKRKIDEKGIEKTFIIIGGHPPDRGSGECTDGGEGGFPL